MLAMEYHGAHHIITAENGRRLIAENVQGDCGLLLAAAPDLLEALRRIAEDLEEEHDGDEFEVAFIHAQEIARAAIAKATGGTS